MTIKLEEQFFKVFGVEPKYIDGCKLSDKYFADEQLQKEYETLDDYMTFECPHQNEYCYSTCQYAYDCSEYPEITDHKLLELICILNKEAIYGYSDWGGSFVIGETVEELKESILTDCIENKSKIFNQIQQLFKEGE